MTRIYFKPQGCCVRNPRSRLSTERMKKSEQGSSSWRKQLDPQSIEQIADGLEKMVLSWTSSTEPPPPATNTQHRLPTPTPSSTGGVDLLLAPMALQEMMRGELIKTCRPSITNGESALAGQQSAEASFWYLTPAKSLPNCTIVSEGQVQNTDGETFAPLEIKMEQKFQEKGPHSEPHKWPRIQSMDDTESGSDTHVKERMCWQKDNCLPETASYHIKAAGSSHWNESIEINAGNQIMELLEKKRMLSGNLSPYTPLLETKEESVELHKKKVEELQIALLECAMEYEVKIVEMKMQMLHFKSEQRQKDGSDRSHSKSGSQKLVSPQEIHLQPLPTSSCHLQEKTDGQQRVEYLRKQLCRLQRENLALSRELNDLKKRERQFDLQRRSLDDALGRVNALQRELGKREQEIVNCQLREKEVRAQLYEVQLALHKAQAAQIEPRKLLSLLPALREWLQTIKKVPCCELMEPREKARSFCSPPVDSIVCSVTKEIQALQKALSKLASKK